MNGDGGLGREFVSRMRKGHERRNRMLAKTFDMRDFRSLQAYVNAVLADGIDRKRRFELGNLPSNVVKALKGAGYELKTTNVVITDEVVLKYIQHPKSKKEADIKLDHFYKVYRALMHPTRVYVDTTDDKNLILVFGRGFSKKAKTKNERTIVKVVIQANYRKKGRTYNWLKSVGFIPAHNMEKKKEDKVTPVYKRIQIRQP